MTSGQSILGHAVVRREDPTFLTVGGTYVDDLDIPGAGWVTFVRSTVAHARLTTIDIEHARRAPGVIDVITHQDIDVPPPPAAYPGMAEGMTEPPLADGCVRYVGQPVVAVLAESRAAGADAAELVEVDYDVLDAVVSVLRACENDAPLLFPDAGTNVAFALDPESDPALFDGCDVVVRERFVNQRVAACPLEMRAAVAEIGPSGRLVFHATTQSAHSVRDWLCRAFDLEPDDVHVVVHDVGGGFGAKTRLFPEEAVVAWLARRHRRPVRWTETRSESMLGLGHARGQVQTVTIGGTREGRIEAYRLEILQDGGAYATTGCMIPMLTRMMAPGVYDIAKVECAFRSVVTNTVPVGAYRGAGRPEATTAIERAVDRFAAELGIDPAELRVKNFVAADAFPHETAMGVSYDSGDYSAALQLAADTADYKGLRVEQARRRDEGDPVQLGIGLSTYVEVTNPMASGEYGAVEVHTDGKVTVRTGTTPYGQGHVTAWSMLAADVLGVAVEDVEVVFGDTDLVPRGEITGGSRSLQVAGSAVHLAAGHVVDMARELAAELLEADPADIVLHKPAARFHVAGVPSVACTWAQVASISEQRRRQPLAAEADFVPDGQTFPFGAHCAVVEVDTETGAVTLRSFVAIDDAGRILNPLLAHGQVHGGIAQGVAQALLEDFRYDDDGNPLTGNLADYSFISAAELPSFETIFTETPTPRNPLGAKGIGESGTIGSTVAVQNAVVDALSSYGILHLDMPATPERVWRALQEACA